MLCSFLNKVCIKNLVLLLKAGFKKIKNQEGNFDIDLNELDDIIHLEYFARCSFEPFRCVLTRDIRNTAAKYYSIFLLKIHVFSWDFLRRKKFSKKNAMFW